MRTDYIHCRMFRALNAAYYLQINTWLLIVYLITVYFLSDDVKVEPKVEVKVEKVAERPITSQGSNKAPPEKKPKLIRQDLISSIQSHLFNK